MKQIIVPTDLSKSSVNSIDYAINLAVVMDARVTLVHVYHPAPVSIDGVTMVDPDFRHIARTNFESFVATQKEKYESYEVDINSEFLVGFAAERILEYSEESRAYMIVMGTTGASMLKSWFGSVSIEVMKKSNVPVLLLPPETAFKFIERIAFADDFTKNHDQGLAYLKDMESEFLANIYCLHVTDSDSESHDWIDLSELSERYKGVKLEQIELKDRDVVHGLLKFCSENNVDILMMPSKKKGFVFNLFAKSVTREMSLSTTVPLLVIH